jgi:5-methylcytosine-specific restriction enzyme subunit McrC
MRPDLVWYADGVRPAAVIDAKYKAERPEGFPHASPTSCSPTAPHCNCQSATSGTPGQREGIHLPHNPSGKQIKALLGLAKEPAELLSDVAALTAAIGRHSE